jgi:hypothetical protein
MPLSIEQIVQQIHDSPTRIVLPDGERVFYVSNPALGLWACRGRLEQ